jgi:Ca-activated chloride channel family protein
MDSNHYSILRISQDASSEEIKHAYKEAARHLHPDVNPDPKSSELFLLIQQAFETLSNPQKRSEYDSSLGLVKPFHPSVKIKEYYSRKKIPRLNNTQLYYLLLEFSPVAALDKPRSTPLNLALVLDRSTSMQGEKLDLVKANAMQIIRQLKPGDVLSIVAFSDNAEVLVSGGRNSDANKFEARLRLLNTFGSTEIFRGLEAAYNEIVKHLNPGVINHIILITDGHTYGDEGACFRLAEHAAEQGIGISGLGLGNRWNDEFLDKLTGFSGGNSIYVSVPKDLHQYLGEKFHHLNTVFAEKITFEYIENENATLNYAFRLTPEPGPLQMKSPIKLGTLLSSSSFSIILEFLIKTIPEKISELVIAKGRIMMEVPSKMIPLERIYFNIHLPIDDNFLYEPPNPSILNAMSRLSLYRMQEKARQEVLNGDISQATRHLQYLATHLLSRGERELAHTVLVEAENIQKSHQFTTEGDKRIKFGTRNLLLPPGMENENL